MGREVAILGVGMTPFRRLSGRSLSEMGREAGLMALKDAGVDYRDVQVGFMAHVNQMPAAVAAVFGPLGLTGIPITRVESACASHSRGVFLAAELIAGGAYDIAMVIGVEKMPRGLVPAGPVDPAAISYEGRMGLATAPGGYAEKATRHMGLYGSKQEHFARVAVKEHQNASLNPYATYRDIYTLEEILNSRPIAYPVTLYMSSANTDGAAATVLCSMKKARQYTANPVRLVGWGNVSPLHVKGEPVAEVGPIDVAARKAYEMSGIGPEDVDIVQLHNAFSICEIVNLELMGLVPKGEGHNFVWEGNTDITGKLPVNTDGGLVGRGHPIGATGGAMMAELVWQLRGQAGVRQVPKKPKTALLENDGAGGSCVKILKI